MSLGRSLLGRAEARAARVAGERGVRFVEFCAVGGVGMVLDLALTGALLGSTHYLLANATGWGIAVSSNFAGNWWVTWDRPEGSLPHQYASYVLLHAATFGLRAAALVALVELAGVPVLAATLIGIGVAAVANYLGTERILEHGLEWFDFVAALNSLALAVYGWRLRWALRATGLYGLLYTAYMHLLALCYRDDDVAIAAGGATATVGTATPPEIVSVLHTLDKERSVLARFVAALDADDGVWDVGANLGVYSALASDVAGRVVAFEPLPDTAARCEANLGRNGGGRVLDVALADRIGTATLAVERGEVGTQTPALSDAGSVASETVTGDALVAEELAVAPDALKIDVEGAECAVLDGCETVLQAVRVALVEVHDNRDAVEARLRDAGLTVEWLVASGQSYALAQRE
jgi:FkbM family methyltransferase